MRRVDVDGNVADFASCFSSLVSLRVEKVRCERTSGSGAEHGGGAGKESIGHIQGGVAQAEAGLFRAWMAFEYAGKRVDGKVLCLFRFSYYTM